MTIFEKYLNYFITRPLLKFKLNRVGYKFRFGYSSNLECAESFSFGDSFYSGPYGYFSSNKDTPVIIGSYVMFGPYCKIIGGNHNISWINGVME